MAQRVVRQRRQADHRVEASQLAGLRVPHVARRSRTDVIRGRAEVAPLVQAQVEPADLVPRRPQERDKDRTDIAAITRDHDPHRKPTPDSP